MKIIVATHSVIDLITNSSTEMFIDFSGSVEPLKALIDEFFKASSIDKTCDDVFKITIRPSWWDDRDYQEDAEEEFNDSWEDDGESSTVLHIETLDDSYNHLGELIKKFIASAETGEYSC